MPRLPSSPNSLIPLVVLAEATPASVSKVLEHVPKYSPGEVRRLVKNTVGAIHQIPRILKKRSLPELDLKDIEAYFGRSSGSADIPGTNLYGRFRAGLERGDTHGMVFAHTTIRASLRFERFGITLINHLKKVDGLCISNKTLASHGRVGSTEPGFLYLTFKVTEGDEHARKLTQREIDAGVASILRELEAEPVVMTKSIQESAARTALELANDVEFTGEHHIALAR